MASSFIFCILHHLLEEEIFIMKIVYGFTLIVSLLCLGLQGCSSCAPKGELTPEGASTRSEPENNTQPEKELPQEQNKADGDTQPQPENASEEASPKTSEAQQKPEMAIELNWPFMKDDFIATDKIPDAAKYAYAIHRALGCPFDETPMETYRNGRIFDVHDLESCVQEDREDELLKRLIDNKADINAYNADGKTLLTLSLFHAGGDYELEHETEVFDLLLKYGADITKPNADGSTILMKTDFIKTAEKYIAAGGDIHAKNKDGKTALDLQTQKLDKMENGEEIEGNHFDYFYEEASMRCQNDEDIEKAEKKGKKPPECITYADIMKDNVRKIIQLIKTKG